MNLQQANEGQAALVTPAAIEIDAHIFRAYDIRGIVGESLNRDVSYAIGQALATLVLEANEDTLLVAKDGRLSGPLLEEALVQGVLAQGVNVGLCGAIPTPLLYFATKTLPYKSGVIITGSHNPANHNGFKIVINDKALFGSEINNIYQLIKNKSFISSNKIGQIKNFNIIPEYIKAVKKSINIKKPLAIAIDCGNGITGVVARELFTALGCKVTMLLEEVDGSFPNHHPDPGQPKNLALLQETVMKLKLDAGFAFDGDGDRCGIVSNLGEIIWPDRLLILFAKYLQDKTKPVIFDVKCSQYVAKELERLNIIPIMYKTGHSLIKSHMHMTGALLAGEMSGHIFIKENWYGFDDGLFTAAKTLEILASSTYTLAELMQDIPEALCTPEIVVPVDEADKFALIAKAQQKAQLIPDGILNTIDGIRVDFPYGFGLVRASNTSANLILRFEASNEEKLEYIKTIFRDLLEEVIW